MSLRKLVLLAVSVIIFGCKGDNDDIIEPNDVINVDLNEGIIFGTINTTGTNDVYKYTNEGIFLVNNADNIVTDMVWTTGPCPFSEASVTTSLTKDVPNLARGIRDIVSTDITETLAVGDTFYILEYVTSGIIKRIQFTSGNGFNEEQINTYFSYIRDTLAILDLSSETPLIFDTDSNQCL